MAVQYSGDLDGFYFTRRKCNTGFVLFFCLIKSCLFILLRSVTQCKTRGCLGASRWELLPYNVEVLRLAHVNAFRHIFRLW